MDEYSGEYEYGSAMGMMAPGTSMGGSGRSTKGLRWLTLTGLLPIAKQTQAYTEAFYDAQSSNPARDVPMYVGYRVERAEVNGAGEADQLPWKPIDLKQPFAVQKSFRVPVQEVVHGKYVPRQPTRAIPMVFPLPPIMNAKWGSEVAHPPGIPLLSNMSELERRSGSAYGAAYSEDYGTGDLKEGDYETGDLEALKRVLESGGSGGPGSSASPYALGGASYAEDEMMGGMGAEMYGSDGSAMYGSGMYGHANPVGEQVELQLFRFMDFSVEPGKRYRYRVQLLLANPNFQVEARFLETEDLAKQPWVEAQWSDPSGVIAVPRDSMLLLGPVKPPNTINDEPVATVMARTFRIEKGLEMADLFQVVRGQLANLQREEKAPTVAERRADRARRAQGTPEYDGYGDEEMYYSFGDEEYSYGVEMPGMPRRPIPDKKTETEPVSHQTGMLVLDVYGGARLSQNDPTATEPAAKDTMPVSACFCRLVARSRIKSARSSNC